MEKPTGNDLNDIYIWVKEKCHKCSQVVLVRPLVKKNQYICSRCDSNERENKSGEYPLKIQ